jgi:hypothetical protein
MALLPAALPSDPSVCPNQFDLWVDGHKKIAVLALVGIFALFGGLK